MVKGLPVMQRTWVRSLGWEVFLEMGNSNSLQCSCLENPMDGRAWQAIVRGVAESDTAVTVTQPVRHMVVLFLNFKRNSVLFSLVAVKIYIPHNSVKELIRECVLTIDSRK